MKKYRDIQIGEIVANDFRAASVFKNSGIDFCCGGKMTLSKACEGKSVDMSTIEKELSELENIPQSYTHNFKEWNLDFLCDYIVNTHHKFVLKTLPELLFYTQKIADVHGSIHPELIEVAAIFKQIYVELLQHLEKEEQVLFPAIKKALANNSDEIKSVIISEIERMSGEHEFAGGAMDKINVITKNYLLPKDACSTYQVTFKLLEQFEDDLHIHVHLENNILYPKALELTK